MRIRFTALVPFVFVTALGCSTAGKPPATAASSDQSAYAIGYSDEIAATTKATSLMLAGS